MASITSIHIVTDVGIEGERQIGAIRSVVAERDHVNCSGHSASSQRRFDVCKTWVELGSGTKGMNSLK